MKYTEKEILDALNLIKDICFTYYKTISCKGCPFANNSGECVIHKEFPDVWRVKETTSFRAFKE